jgi:hypothetical protein
MSVLKDGRYPINLDKPRHLLFSLNVLDEVQDRCGGYDKLSEFLQGKDMFKHLRWILTLLLNEGAEKDEDALTEQQLGRLIHTGNLNEVQIAIFKAFSLGVNGGEESDEEDIDTDDEKKS